uniref:UPF0728 protein C10orf53 homolog n=1 Tax=Agelaius phoeniceus TaxID=39638 RepID=UPI0023EDFEE1|nr:UPF0728 protein C10orf53 homolog [Agelaius phoeniceus]
METFKPKCSCKVKYFGVVTFAAHSSAVISSNQHKAGAAAGLEAEGHHLILEVVTNWNAVDLVVDRDIVFHCNIYDLGFGGDGKLDPLCEEARKAVLNA